jgi:hypothetical protein
MKNTLRSLLLVSLCFGGCLCATPVRGTKVGVITSLADEGLFCPTHEGTLIRGGLSNGTGVASGQAITFNVADGAVLEQARAAMEKGTEVSVDFYRPMVASVCSRADKQDVTVTAIHPRQ